MKKSNRRVCPYGRDVIEWLVEKQQQKWAETLYEVVASDEYKESIRSILEIIREKKHEMALFGITVDIYGMIFRKSDVIDDPIVRHGLVRVIIRDVGDRTGLLCTSSVANEYNMEVQVRTFRRTVGEFMNKIERFFTSGAKSKEIERACREAMRLVSKRKGLF